MIGLTAVDHWRLSSYETSTEDGAFSSASPFTKHLACSRPIQKCRAHVISSQVWSVSSSDGQQGSMERDYQSAYLLRTKRKSTDWKLDP